MTNSKSSSTAFSYASSGVNIDSADAAKREMAKSLQTKDPRVLNSIGAFASLFEATFPGVANPVLVMKMEEPGSKQKLAIESGRIESLCYDLVNHLVNDIAVMGADPLAVQDVIVCGKLEPEVVTKFVDYMAAACRSLGCSLVGGETSEQPGVLPAGSYVLAASVVGVVDKNKRIDGTRIEKGDVVLAVASNGLHTNGYSLVRALLAAHPTLKDRMVDGKTFFDRILLPHTPYLKAFQAIREHQGLTGLAHITGGGIQGNLNRILPKQLSARVHLSEVEVLPVFKVIQEVGGVSEADLLKTFNLGVGVTAVCRADAAKEIISKFQENGHKAYAIGDIVAGAGEVLFEGTLRV